MLLPEVQIFFNFTRDYKRKTRNLIKNYFLRRLFQAQILVEYLKGQNRRLFYITNKLNSLNINFTAQVYHINFLIKTKKILRQVSNTPFSYSDQKRHPLISTSL